MLVTGEWLRPFLAARIPVPDEDAKAVYIGVLKGDAVKGVAVVHKWDGEGCEVSYAGDRGWMDLGALRRFWRYVWDELGAVRVTARIRDDNALSLAYAKRMGFVEEGRLRRAWAGHDVVILGMLAEECRYGRKA